MKKVVFASNQNYFEYLITAAHSVIRNSTNPKKIQIYVIDCGLTKKQKKELLKKNYKIININYKKYMKLKQISYLGYSTYCRIEIPNIFPKEKILYLDCDVLILGDIEKVFNIDLRNKTIAAVKDYDLSLLNKGRIFNAGVMLINCKQWNKREYTKKFFKWHSQNYEKILLADQCVLNGILENDWKELPLEWNRQRILLEYPCKMFRLSKEDYLSLKEKPKIIHFTGRFKPTNKRYVFEDKKDYLKYYKLAGFNKKDRLTISDLGYIPLRKMVYKLKIRPLLERLRVIFFSVD
jgi:lipopolysaccharide biosynthesis glycosyltransferase